MPSGDRRQPCGSPGNAGQHRPRHAARAPPAVRRGHRLRQPSSRILVGISIAIYDKKFTAKTMVTVKADRTGLQLARFGDVRMHGALVGYVDNVASDGQHAKITAGPQAGGGPGHPVRRQRPDPADHAVRAELHRVLPAEGRSRSQLAARRFGHPGEPGEDERRAAAHPGRPVSGAPRDQPGRRQRDAVRALARSAGQGRGHRADARCAQHVPRHDEQASYRG